jgi:hypothetical protein
MNRNLVAGLCMVMLALGACRKSTDGAKPDADDKAAGIAKPAEAETPESGRVMLTPGQVEKLGVQTEEVKAVEYAEETSGFGTVIPRETIAQASAELATAEATEKQSRAALARTRRLSGTPGAMSADVEETNARQASVDTAALTLARQRLSATFGQNAPWSNGANPALLQDLANGRAQLVRATFPLGTLGGEIPKILRASRIGQAATGKGWKMSLIWTAPADASVPGRSFFALLRGSDLGEGERIIVSAPVGAAQPGVVIPAEAAVIKDGKYWCYVEEKPGTFVRTEIDTGRPFENGYFVAAGVKRGDKVVTNAAAQLVAKESNTGADAD